MFLGATARGQTGHGSGQGGRGREHEEGAYEGGWVTGSQWVGNPEVVRLAKESRVQKYKADNLRRGQAANGWACVQSHGTGRHAVPRACFKAQCMGWRCRPL